MIRERKNLIPIVNDESILKCIETGNEKEISKMTLKVMADIRVFLRKIYKKLPKNTDVQVLTGGE
ncbi:MAG: hypothetical protein ACTSWG_13245 [Candidatus Helarchaeota archaeon]